MSEITGILSQVCSDGPGAAEQLLPLVYDELRKLAASKLACEKPGQTLQATALVHEAYLRLVGGVGGSEISSQQSAGLKPTSGLQPLPSNHWNSRGHFFAAAAEAMRRILIDRARACDSAKRGGNRRRLELTDMPRAEEELRVDDILDLDEALRKLAAVDPEAAKLVELRVFAGQSVSEAAAILSLNPSTAKRAWNYGRAWLRREVGGEEAASDHA